jgi:hypothetical protein
MLIAERPPIIWTAETVTIREDVEQQPSLREWKIVEARLQELWDIAEGWGVDDNHKPSLDILHSVVHLLAKHRALNETAPTRIIPTEEGSLIIEWVSPGILTSLEVEEPYRGGLWSAEDGKPSTYKTIRWERNVQSSASW